MARDGIFRVEKRDSTAAVAMAKHALRDGVRVPNAVPGAPPPEVIKGLSKSGEVIQRLTELVKAARARKQAWRANNIAMLDMLFTYSHGAIKNKEDQDNYFKKCIEWVEKEWPTCIILCAAIHRDETTPHLQVLVAPIDQKGHFNAKQLVGGPTQYSMRQDSFWENCSKQFGLERGEKGSKAKHIPVRTFYSHAAAQLPDSALELEQVPPPPVKNWPDVISGVYAEKKKAREDIIARNNEKTKLMNQRSRSLRSLHPVLLAKEAEKYREAVRLEKLTSEKLDAIKKKEADLKLTIAESKTHLKQIEAAIEHTQTQAYIKEYDQFSKRATGFYVARLAQQLGIELVPGKGLIDQVRRGLGLQGSGASLLAIQRLDEAAEAVGIVPIGRQMGDQQDGNEAYPAG